MISRRNLLQSATAGAASLAPASLGAAYALSGPAPALFSPGFSLAEAQLLLEIANKTYDGTPTRSAAAQLCGVPAVPAPPGNWTLRKDLTPTQSTLLDNYWQIWQNTSAPKQFAIAVRGTVNTIASIFADVFCPLIDARIDVPVGPITLPLYLARAEGDTAVKAGVHGGFLLSLLLMLFTTDKPLIATLPTIAKVGNQIYVTGHSQGASIATLMTSFFGRSPWFQGPSYKSYTFAPAKPGNDHYAYDYAQLAGVKGAGWSVVSTQDWVPEVPFGWGFIQDMNTPNPLRHFGGALDAGLIAYLDAALGGKEQEVEKARADVLAALTQRFRQKVDGLAGRLADTRLNLRMSDLGAPSSAPVTGTTLSGILQQLLKLILPSLNYADAGGMVPLLAVPGGNPTDGKGGCQDFDFFWQHHLGLYWKYLNEQYRG